MKVLPNIEWETILQITQRLDFFKKFTVHEQKRMIGLRSTLCTFEKDEYLIRDGDKDTFFFVLLSGSVNVSKGEKTPPFATLEAGDFFGEIAFLTKCPRTANVTANETVIVIRIDKEMLSRLDVEIREKFKDKVIDKLVTRLDNMNNAFVNRWS